MAEAFLTSDLATAILSKLLSLVAEQVSLAWGLKDDLNSLKYRMELVHALLSDAETKSITMQTVRLWLSKLNVVARDADALLDELAYRALQQKVENHHKVLNYFSLFRYKTANKIKNINQSLDGIYRNANEIGLKPLGYISSITAKSDVIRQTPPKVDESEIVGREDDKSKIIEMLRGSNDEKDLSIIAIVGMPGLGKTALAQVLYNNAIVVKHFGERIWVTVSKDFDIIRILNEMVQSLTRKNPQLSSLDALIKELSTVLCSRKFLLVLDDVWEKNLGKWEDMRNSLLGIGSPRGNKILITTRSQAVAQIMLSSFIYPLARLSFDDGWKIFKQRAFAIGGAQKTEKFKAIGKRMVKRCDGVPLAIKALGGSLYSMRSEREWLLTEENPCWDSIEVLPKLEVSFNHLQPSSLKHCFAFCSIFPKDFIIEKDWLIRLWMALGLLHHPEKSDMEDIGEDYFNILLWNSFLQDVEKDDYDNLTRCKMHDLIHDLALAVSKKNCLTLAVGEVKDDVVEPSHVRMIVAYKEKIPKFLKGSFARLHTLYLEGGFNVDILKSLKNLRILVLLDRDMEQLPSSIGEVKHLRYVDISKTKITTLPDSITKLFLLQTLRINYLNQLPKMFGRLISLRHLYFQSIWQSMNCMFVGIGRLTCLQTLPFFVVSRAEGCRLEELGGLDNLTFELEIYGLQDVRNLEEAKKANLYKKSKIQALVFHWDLDDEGEEDREHKKIIDVNASELNDVGVLEGLEPHSNLKDLKIRNFKGKSFASWIMKTDQSCETLHNLVKIELVDCNRCERIPTLGHLPCLKDVLIDGMNNVKCMGTEFYGYLNNINNSNSDGVSCSNTVAITVLFPSLRKLALRNMTNLEEWLQAIGVDDPSSPSTSTPKVFPCLEKLVIFNCPELIMVPSHFPSLKELDIRLMNDSVGLEKMSTNLTLLTALTLEYVGGFKFLFALEHFLDNNRSLTQLNVRGCEQLTELPDCLRLCMSLERLTVARSLALVPDLELRHLTNLTNLEIGGFCPELHYFPWPNLSSSLRTLWLEGWPKLKSLPEQLQDLSASLTILGIVGFHGLETLPDWLGNLSNLQSLVIFNCKNLKNMPSVEAMQCLCKLNLLQIYECPLLEERCTKGSGPEWYKIAHVPHVWISLCNLQIEF